MSIVLGFYFQVRQTSYRIAGSHSRANGASQLRTDHLFLRILAMSQGLLKCVQCPYFWLSCAGISNPQTVASLSNFWNDIWHGRSQAMISEMYSTSKVQEMASKPFCVQACGSPMGNSVSYQNADTSPSRRKSAHHVLSKTRPSW